MTSSLADRVAHALRERGLSVADAPEYEPRVETTDERHTRIAAALDRRVPARYRTATPTHDSVRAWTSSTMAGGTDSLFLAGTTGTGKTWQAFGAVRALVLDAPHRGRTLTWDYVTHPDLAAQSRPKPDNSHLWVVESYLDVNVLVIDDLGATKTTDWGADVLYRIADHRDHHELPTIWITNLEPTDLSDAVPERIRSRLLSGIRTTLTGADRRRAPKDAR